MKLFLLILLASSGAALVAPGVVTRRVALRSSPPSEGEAPVPTEEPVAAEERNAELLRDIARLKSERVVEPAPPVSAMQNVVNVLGAILSVNFVVIVGLFLWFLYGVFSLYALDNSATITLVKASFDPIILPILSTHMGLTFLSAGLENLVADGDD